MCANGKNAFGSQLICVTGHSVRCHRFAGAMVRVLDWERQASFLSVCALGMVIRLFIYINSAQCTSSHMESLKNGHK